MNNWLEFCTAWMGHSQRKCRCLAWCCRILLPRKLGIQFANRRQKCAEVRKDSKNIRFTLRTVQSISSKHCSLDRMFYVVTNIQYDRIFFLLLCRLNTIKCLIAARLSRFCFCFSCYLKRSFTRFSAQKKWRDQAIKRMDNDLKRWPLFTWRIFHRVHFVTISFVELFNCAAACICSLRLW